MPQRTGVTGSPRSYLVPKGAWPEGPFRRNTPRAVYYAALIAKKFKAAIDESGQSITAVAEALDVARSTVYDVLKGETVADVRTLALAEAHFGVRLWPEPDEVAGPPGK